MSQFDVSSFMSQAVTDANDTKVIPVPAGEHVSLADKVEIKEWASKTDSSKAGLKLVIQWAVDNAEVKELLGRDKVTVRQDIMLDLTDAGTLDMGRGRNVQLGKLREALNLNLPGQPFSFDMIQGRVAKILVAHRIDGDTIYADVKGVAPMN